MKFLNAFVVTASTLLASCGGGGGGGYSGTAPVNCFAGVKTSSTPYPQVTMVTTKGSIVLELYPLNAPATVANFLQYVTDGFYKDKIFHRVISNFVVQGGGFDAQLNLAIVKRHERASFVGNKRVADAAAKLGLYRDILEVWVG